MSETKLPLIVKHSPKSSKEIVGQQAAVEKAKDFLINFKRQKKRGMLLHGPSGSGKTCMIHALAKDMGYELVEINASDFRNEEGLLKTAGNASRQMSLFSTGKIILIDEVDGLAGNQDRGGVSTIAKILETSAFPIILTANDIWDNKFSTLRTRSELVELKPLTYAAIFGMLEKICQAEGIKYDETALKSLATRAGGDLRAAIIDLQILTERTMQLDRGSLEGLSEREKEDSIINALAKIFKTTDLKVASKALDSVNEDNDKVMLWIDENLPKEYDGADLAAAYSHLSKADVFTRRIRRRQHWRYLVYINSMLTSGIASAKTHRPKAFVPYKPTMRLLKVWQANRRNGLKNAVAETLAEHTHVSKRQAISQMPYLMMIFSKDKTMSAKISAELKLNKEEIGWLKGK